MPKFGVNVAAALRHLCETQWELSRTDNDQVLEDYMEEVRRDKIMKGEISLLGVMQVCVCQLAL